MLTSRSPTFVNAFPKMGLHATAKACELLGVPVFKDHRSCAEGAPEGTTHHVFARRDPRNAIISKLRHENKSVTAGTFIAKFRDYDNGKSAPIAMREYVLWLATPGVHVVTFEDLTRDDAELRRLAAFLGVPYLADAFTNLPGLTMTWTGEYSDYHKIWTPEVDAVWNAEGGPLLLSEWGYYG